MNTAVPSSSSSSTLPRPAGPGGLLRRAPRELLRRQPTLTLFAALLLLLVLPAALAWGIDERTLRGANVWIKPIKFMVSIAVLSLTTAWFIGDLPAERRGSRAVRAIVAAIVVAGGFEIFYIGLQAGLGQGSHFNVGDRLHATMYQLMGVGAVTLTASQAALAWQLARHPDAALAPAYRLAAVLGLGLSFLLGTATGAPLSAMQPPTGPGVPLLGWSTVAGDLRPAHFLGIHAAQLLPLAGAAIAAAGLRRGRVLVGLIALLYSAACVGLMAQALAGRPFTG